MRLFIDGRLAKQHPNAVDVKRSLAELRNHSIREMELRRTPGTRLRLSREEGIGFMLELVRPERREGMAAGAREAGEACLEFLRGGFDSLPWSRLLGAMGPGDAHAVLGGREYDDGCPICRAMRGR